MVQGEKDKEREREAEGEIGMERREREREREKGERERERGWGEWLKTSDFALKLGCRVRLGKKYNKKFLLFASSVRNRAWE